MLPKITRIRVHKNSLHKFEIQELLTALVWAICIFCYFFQFYFRGLSRFIVPCICLFILFEYRNILIGRDKLYNLLLCIYFIILGFECFNSIFRNNSINQIIRFLEILTFIPICLFINDKNFINEYRILIFFAVIKSLILIGIALYLVKLGNHTFIRNYFHNISGGDVFLAGGIRPKVQLHGNGILPYVFMLYNFRKRKIDYITIILLLGILCAGNFAFILCLGAYLCFICYKMICSKQNKNGLITVVILLIFNSLLPVTYKHLEKTVEQKSVNSNAIRIEQANFLTDTNYVIGKGLGNNIHGNGQFRSYDNNTYFELQTLYIFNQIGVIGLSLFYIIILFWVWKKDSHYFIIFLIYLFYTFWNPYCFDTTEMIAIISLLNLPLQNRNNNKRTWKLAFYKYIFLYK